jgi:aspartate/methionine/tyrosine aminotransferase
MSISAIRELEEIYYLKEVTAEYKIQNGANPFELSHWDPSDQLVKALLSYLKLPPLPLAAPYIYSYYLEVQQQIVRGVGYTEPTRTCLLVQAGTSAMLLATWWVKSLNIERLIIMCPAYFPIFYLAQMLGLNHIHVYMSRDQGAWQIPKDEILSIVHGAPSNTAIWITNPVFCTGSYLSESDIEFLDSLLKSGVAVVADECLSVNGYEIGKRLIDSDRLLALYSPHKSVCLNAVKFAAIVFDVKYQLFFDDWADVLVGGLAASSHSAIHHFLSDNFLHYQSAFLESVNATRSEVIQMFSSSNSLIETDENSIGYFLTCYAPRIAGSNGNNREFLRQLVFDTGALVVPGLRNHFSPDIGFNFRINLARRCPQFFSALHRVLEFLTKASKI